MLQSKHGHTSHGGDQQTSCNRSTALLLPLLNFLAVTFEQFEVRLDAPAPVVPLGYFISTHKLIEDVTQQCPLGQYIILFIQQDASPPPHREWSARHGPFLAFDDFTMMTVQNDFRFRHFLNHWFAVIQGLTTWLKEELTIKVVRDF